MDDNFFKDLLNISLDEDMFQRLVEEVRNDPDTEMNFQPEDSFRGCLIQIILSSPLELQHEIFQNAQTSTNLRSSELTSTTVAFSQNQLQDHSQRSSTYDMHQTPQFQTEEAAFIASREVSSSEAVMHKDFASSESQQHVQHQSHQEKVFSYATPFPLPLPHTSISITNPPACMIPQEQEPSSKNSPDDRPMEPNPTQMINLEEMEQLINTFKRTREILGFTQEEVNLVLAALSDEPISQQSLNRFERLRTIFESMCVLKHDVELVLEDMDSSRRTSHSSLNTSESIVPGSPMEAVTGTTQKQDLKNVFLQNSKPDAVRFATNFSSGMCGAVSNDSPEKTTGAVPDDRTTQEAIDNSENVQHVIQLSQPQKTMSLEELLQSIEILRSRRKKLNLRQIDVKSELARRNIPVTNLQYFETFGEFISEMFHLKCAMEEWLKDIHFSESQVKMSSRTREILKAFFQWNPTPDAQDISRFAKRVNLDPELVTIWFQKYLQIKKCTKVPTDSAGKFTVRHPHHKPQQ